MRTSGGADEADVATGAHSRMRNLSSKEPVHARAGVRVGGGVVLVDAALGVTVDAEEVGCKLSILTTADAKLMCHMLTWRSAPLPHAEQRYGIRLEQFEPVTCVRTHK